VNGRALALACLAVALVQSPERARAQTSSEARADALFNEARQLRKQGHYADACAKFAQSKELAPGVGVSLHLADCYEHIGRTDSAWREFQSAEKAALELGDARAEVAHARAKALEARLASLASAGAPPTEAAPATPATDAPHSSDVPSAPPAPVPAVSAPAPAVSAPAPVPAVSAPAPAVSAPAPVPASPPTASGGDADTRRAISHGLVGAAFLGIGIGAVLMAVNTPSAPQGAPADQARPDPDVTAGAVVAFAAGGAALVSALVLYCTTPAASNAHSGSALVVTPVPLPGGAGGFLRATF
jgi:hypothetical protein